ncbi:chemotaxis response regulator protein-glutamate methylesterase [Candidatus Kapaibacterium sp.]
MNIAIINDSVQELLILQKCLKDMNSNIIWTATSINESLAKFQISKPELVITSLKVKNSDAAVITKELNKISPIPVLVLAHDNERSQAKVFEAMSFGALDVVKVPIYDGDIILGKDEFLKKIDTLSKLLHYHEFTGNKATANSPSLKRTKIIAIGSSTGGPKALSIILSNIPTDFPSALIIVQHVDAQFTYGLVDWLKNYSRLPIQLIKEGDYPLNGKIYIAHTNDHLVINKKGEFEYTHNPIHIHYRPSVDVFFESLKNVWQYNDIAILLTGMGADGAKGLLELRKKGWHTIAQDESTSTVYGMPKAAAENNSAIEILPIQKISDAILKQVLN